jgi:hypothetical protein
MKECHERNSGMATTAGGEEMMMMMLKGGNIHSAEWLPTSGKIRSLGVRSRRARAFICTLMMMMSFICSCRNKR